MRLYHYLEAKWALDDIRRRRIKLSRIDDLNDPFELKCVRSGDERTQVALESTASETVERYGVECFSRSWNNVLMWSHYGERHEGMCLGFDVPEELTRPVEYVTEVLITGDLIVEKLADSPVEECRKIIDRMLGAKYAGWAYEQEVRVHGQRSEVDEETGQFFVDFSERLVLKEVIAGVRCQVTKRLIEDALAGYSGIEGVKVLKACCSTTGFEIIADQYGFDGSGITHKEQPFRG